MYDSTKFEEAFKLWLETNVTIGFGEHYAGDLLDDFDNFLRETKMLKRSPGRVVFGKELAKHGEFDRRKRMGLTYWSGLELNSPPLRDALKPKRYAKTVEAQEERAIEQDRIKRDAAFQESPGAEKARLAAFKRELDTETAEHVKQAGDE